MDEVIDSRARPGMLDILTTGHARMAGWQPTRFPTAQGARMVNGTSRTPEERYGKWFTNLLFLVVAIVLTVNRVVYASNEGWEGLDVALVTAGGLIITYYAALNILLYRATRRKNRAERE